MNVSDEEGRAGHDDAAAEALHALRGLHAAAEAMIETAADRYGINRNDLRCLEIIQREGAIPARRLAALSHLSPAAITKIVDRLEAAGYVTRTQSAHDRRSSLIDVSTHHRALRRDFWDPVVREMTSTMKTLPPSDLRQLSTLVRALTADVTNHVRRLSDRDGDGDGPS